MTPTGTQVGAIVANTVLFLIIYITNKDAFDEMRGFSIVALALGVFVAAGLVFGPNSFAEAVARNLGGPTVALLLLWGVRLQRIIKEALRRSSAFVGWILEAAAASHAAGLEDAHRYVDRLLSGGAIKPNEATSLHDQLVLLRRIPIPNNQ